MIIVTDLHGGNVYDHPGCLDFSANIHPLGMPDGVRRAICEAAMEAVQYPDPDCTDLRRAIAEKEKVLPDQVICGNGAADLIYLLCRACNGCKALVPQPSFTEYERALTSSGWTVLSHFLDEKKEFCPDDSLSERIRTEKPDLVFLCNPNNPTGIPYPPELLRDILEACKESGSRLAVDECFLDFVQPGKASSMVKDSSRFPGLFILKAFTKSYGMPGVRLGYGITSDTDLLERMRMNVQPWNVSLIAQKAGLAALQDTSHIQKGRAIVEVERRFLSEALDGQGFIVCRGEANFILFRTGSSLADLLKRRRSTLFRELLEKGILIRDCSNFAGLCEGYYRIAVRTHEENRRFTEALKEVVSDLKRGPAGIK